MSWEQWTQTVITSGDVRVLRLWDAERELKDYDIPTGSNCSVTCIDSTYASMGNQIYTSETRASSPDDEGLVMKAELGSGDSYRRNTHGLIIIGCADGSIRLFDRRMNPNKAKVQTWREHTACVLGLQLRGDKIISGSSAGDVRIFDIRKNNSVSVYQVANDMTALAVHRNADLYAW